MCNRNIRIAVFLLTGTEAMYVSVKTIHMVESLNNGEVCVCSTVSTKDTTATTTITEPTTARPSSIATSDTSEINTIPIGSSVFTATSTASASTIMPTSTDVHQASTTAAASASISTSLAGSSSNISSSISSSTSATSHSQSSNTILSTPKITTANKTPLPGETTPPNKATSQGETTTSNKTTSQGETTTQNETKSSSETTKHNKTTSSWKTTTQTKTTSTDDTNTQNTATSPGETSPPNKATSQGETTTSNETTSLGEINTQNTASSPAVTTTANAATSPGETITQNTATSPIETTTTNTATSPGKTITNTETSPGEINIQNTATSPAITTTASTSTSPFETTTTNTATSPVETITRNTATLRGEKITQNLASSPAVTTTPNTATSPGETTTPNTATSPGETTTPNTATSPFETTTTTDPATSPGETKTQNTATSPGETTTSNKTPPPAGPTTQDKTTSQVETTTSDTTTSPGDTTTQDKITSHGETTSPYTALSSTQPTTSAIATSSYNSNSITSAIHSIIKRRRRSSDEIVGIWTNGKCRCDGTVESHSIAEVNIAVPLRVQINANFSADLTNHTSTRFIEYKKEFTIKLTDKFKDIKGFQYVLVQNFTQGSVVCNSDVVFQGANLAEEAEKNHTAVDIKVNLDGNTFELAIKMTEIKYFFQKAAVNSGCQYVQSKCDRGYAQKCDAGSVWCVHLCSQPDAVNCGEHGSCIFDHRTMSTACRCIQSDTHIFSGELCEVSVEKNKQALVEKLQLESKYIITIAASVGGVIMIAAAVAIACLVYRLRKKAAKNEDDSGEDVALDNLRRSSRTQSENSYEKFRGRHISKEATSNGSIGDLERSEETRVLEGMEHKVTRDEKGNEVYIYQPKQPRALDRQRLSSVYSSASEDNAQTGSSMYDYIDTETKYQIRRPNVSIRTIRI